MSEQGERFADDGHRFRLESRIATGGMGEVWRATDTTLGRVVAVKLLKTEYADDEMFRTRFASEAQHAAALHHPGVAAVYDFGEAAPTDGGGPRPYLVMELVDGQPLSALIRPGQPLDPEVTRDLMAQAGDAIGAAHDAGIIHRDVKPGQPDRHPRPPREDHRLRHRPRHRGHGADPDRPGDGHAPVPLSRAGAGRSRDPGLRRLLARGRDVRVPDQPPAVRRRDPGRDRARPPPRAGAAAARERAERPRRRRHPRDGEGSGRPVPRRRRRTPRRCATRPRSAPPYQRAVPTPATQVLPGRRVRAGHARHPRAAAGRQPSRLPVAVGAAGPRRGRRHRRADRDRRHGRRRDRPPRPADAAVLGPQPHRDASGEPDRHRQRDAGGVAHREQTEAETFDINEGDYVGRDVKEVEGELKTLGPEASQRRSVDNDGTHEEDTVASRSAPTAGLQEGDTVIVSAVARPGGDDAQPDAPETAPGNGTEQRGGGRSERP